MRDAHVGDTGRVYFSDDAMVASVYFTRLETDAELAARINAVRHAFLAYQTYQHNTLLAQYEDLKRRFGDA